MKNNRPTCIFCAETKLYKVSATQYRCVTCKRTFSHEKHTQRLRIIEAFIADQSAHECANRLKLHYQTVAKTYQTLRLLIIKHLETLYKEQSDSFSQYDEYYFLPTCKRGNPNHLFDAIGILGMLYGKRVYTLLLPDQFAHLKNLEENSIEKETYVRYLNQHKLAHYENFENELIDFWRFLESWLEHFKGIKKEHFIYYLKEAEFKFNYTNDEQRSILHALVTMSA